MQVVDEAARARMAKSRSIVRDGLAVRAVRLVVVEVAEVMAEERRGGRGPGRTSP